MDPRPPVPLSEFILCLLIYAVLTVFIVLATACRMPLPRPHRPASVLGEGEFVAALVVDRSVLCRRAVRHECGLTLWQCNDGLRYECVAPALVTNPQKFLEPGPQGNADD